MFEKEAKERAEKLEEDQTLGVYDNEEDYERDRGWNEGEVCGYEEGFKDGAEFGYNKANEWHYVKDGDLPKDDNRIVLCICGNGYIDGKVNYILKLLTRKEFSFFQPVYRWKEIVLPELKENE